jgi:NAD-dependent DNA ligase
MSTLQKQIEQLGGTVVNNIDKKTDVIISKQGNPYLKFKSFFLFLFLNR